MRAKVLTVSDGVAAGTREDRSGPAVSQLLVDAGYEVVEAKAVTDGVESVSGALREMAAAFAGLIVTTGGTGFAPRDLTPEGTAAVLERQASGLMAALFMANPDKGRLSRPMAGTLGQSIVVNLPGSSAGAAECLTAILDVLAHALDLLADRPTAH